ncbi:NAD(P)H-dependent FMN reductase [Deinococcus metalli]|uniref:FMN reductase n=1 Tax=Deinococcus metalli TaxID=1141878 RepID=A0A7W8KGG4_9DEIO|nr:NAD(P)H-dependent oxidoreductase [Deinococcus metalli]MBB5376561.1 NAD(P)H-dependent FMN reductase [Deinococcus metalli]GHF43120.1 FMN reductase [Deinococcus metalli]
MTNPRIAVIIGSTRNTRFADKPTAWFMKRAAARPDLDFEVIDLRDFPLPLFNEVASNAWAPTQNEVGQRWQRTIGGFDGYVLITAEYNHAPTGALKNALDYAYPEWNKKPVTFVGYGSVGAARAIEHLRGIAVELQMAPLRTAVHIQGADFFGAWQQGQSLDDLGHLEPGVTALFEELAWWTRALKTARETTTPPQEIQVSSSGE